METQTYVQRNKRALPDVRDHSKKKVCVRSKEICNARLLLISCGVDWDSPKLDSLGPLPSKRTKSGFVGTFQCGHRWQAQYLHRTLGAYDTAYEAGCAVARAVVHLAALQMCRDSNEVVFSGCLSTLAGKGVGEQAGVKDTPPAATRKDAAVVFSSTPANTRSGLMPFSMPHPGVYAPDPLQLVHPGHLSGTISSPMHARSGMPQARPCLCPASTQATASMPKASFRPDMLTVRWYIPQDRPIKPGQPSVGRAPSFSAPSSRPLPPLLPYMAQPFNGLDPTGQPVFFQQPPVYMSEPGFAQNCPYRYGPTFAPSPSFVPQEQATPPYLGRPGGMPYANVAWNNYAPDFDARQP
eukprot:6204134-Pleurochrysis_carterae.AAC.1